MQNLRANNGTNAMSREVKVYWVFKQQLMPTDEPGYVADLANDERIETVITKADHLREIGKRDERIRQLCQAYDEHVGTPCEQMRHQQQIDDLTNRLTALQRERERMVEALQRGIKTMTGSYHQHGYPDELETLNFMKATLNLTEGA